MLLNLFGILLCVVIFVPLLVIKIIKFIKTKNKPVINSFKVTFFYVGVTLLFVFTIFPLPIDKKCIQNKYLEQVNYLNPLSQFINTYVTIPDDQKDAYIFIYIYIVIKQIMFYAIIYILLSSLRKNNIIIYSFALSFSVEVLQFIIGKIIGLNYKSFNTKDIIIVILGSFLGYFIYNILYKISSRYIQKSDIISFIHKVLY